MILLTWSCTAPELLCASLFEVHLMLLVALGLMITIVWQVSRYSALFLWVWKIVHSIGVLIQVNGKR